MVSIKRFIAAAVLLGSCSAPVLAHSFSSEAFSIPDGSEAYIPIEVSGVADATAVSVTLHNVFHSYPDDMIFGLINESTNTGFIFMSGAGGDIPVFGQTWTFSDSASQFLSPTDYDAEQQPLTDGEYLPSNFDGLEFYTMANAHSLNALLEGEVNGIWSLYTRDRYYFDSGTVAGGFSLDFTSDGSSTNPIDPDPDPGLPPDGNGDGTLPAVPEPMSWALMILGFGFVGARMRYQRERLALQSNS